MAEEQKQLSIQRIYVKDISLETPNSPMIFNEKWEPNVELNLSSNAALIQDNIYEVVLGITVTVKIEDKNAYLVEISQAGLFGLVGFAEQELGQVLGSYCPNTLFPYAREAISDLVTKAGFPPMLLSPVNFDALYAQHVQQSQQSDETPKTVN
ncbi:MAG: protein-export chaperone SecB [Gammaproteobacteria bacterium]|nr:protein-export chaperone SecB [Gammaproteobacteria bacterium]